MDVGFPQSSIKNLPANAGDTGDADLIPGLGISPGEGNGTPLQYSCLENSMDRGAWWAVVYGVTKSRTQLSKFHFHFHLVLRGYYFTRYLEILATLFESYDQPR